MQFTASLRSIVPLDHLEIVCNANIARDINLKGRRDFADVSGTLEIAQSGWCLLRAYSDGDEYPVLDAYPYATTSPIYITVEGSTPDVKADAQYFIAWIDRLVQAAQENQDWNNTQEKEHVLRMLAEARSVYDSKSR